MADRTIVALGCSPDPDYAFLLPITALLWRYVIGFEPLAIIVGRDRRPDGEKRSGALEWALDKHARVAFEALGDLKIPTYSISAVDGYPYAQMAQNCRQHAAVVHTVSTEPTLRDDDWIIPGDCDLWPLQKHFYQRHENSPYKAVSYYWNGDNFLTREKFLAAVNERRRSQTLPTCHIAMRASTWREIYSLEPGTTVSDATKATLDKWFTFFPRNSFNLWMSDQDIMTWKLCQQFWFPHGRPPDDGDAHAKGDVLFVGRRGQPPLDRLDRSELDRWKTPDAPGWVDAHVFRHPWAQDHWAKLRMILAAKLPSEHLAWVDHYRATFVETL